MIGVYCSSNKPHLWSKLHKTLSNCNVDWNLCIAGPNPPLKSLPGNVKYIQTNVKPAQCFLIALHNTTGDYIMNTPDDVEVSDGYLDSLYRQLERGGKYTISSSKWNISKETRSLFNITGKYHWTNQNGKVFLPFTLPAFSMMRRETFNEIGIDKNFLGTYWDIDVSFEIISRGGEIKMDVEHIAGEQDDTNEKLANMSRLTGEYFFLINMWFNKGKFTYKRKKPIDPLVYNDTVLIKSQGRSYPWWS